MTKFITGHETRNPLNRATPRVSILAFRAIPKRSDAIGAGGGDRTERINGENREAKECRRVRNPVPAENCSIAERNFAAIWIIFIERHWWQRGRGPGRARFSRLRGLRWPRWGSSWTLSLRLPWSSSFFLAPLSFYGCSTARHVITRYTAARDRGAEKRRNENSAHTGVKQHPAMGRAGNTGTPTPNNP